MKVKKKRIRRKGRVRRAFVNVFIIVYAVLYIWLIGPAVQFMGNTLPQSQPDNGEALVNSDDTVLDFNFYPGSSNIGKEEDPKETEGTEGDATEEPTPTEEPVLSTGTSSGTDSSLPYVPDPIVDGVTKVNGSSVYLEPDAKNVLVLGVDESAALTDTMMIVSVCDRTKEVQVVSLARDAYVPYASSIRSRIGNSPGIHKLNATMTIGNMIGYSGGKFGNSGIDFLCHVIGELLPNANIDIDDYVYVGESAFADIIDMFGGVNVYVTEDWYSASGDLVGYLVYEKGYHFMTGDEAFDYVRRRGRFGPQGQIASSGDPYRKANQLSFMRDFAKQVVTVENVGKLPQLLETASKYIYHSINNVSKIAEYAEYGMAFAQGKYEMKLQLLAGTSIDPFGDGASYVNIMG